MPARLACIKPAASVRSEPGSNSQVGLETLNRLITTFDEVPPLLVASDSHRLQPWCYLLNVTAEVFRPTAASKKSLRLRRWCGPQGPRRPRFSFFYSVFKQPGAEAPHSPGIPSLKLAGPPDDDSQPTTGRLPIHSSR